MMEANIKNDRICTNCFNALRTVITINRKHHQKNEYYFYCYCFIIADSKALIEKAGGIEVSLNCINDHINNVYTCILGSAFLSLMLKESSKSMSTINSKPYPNRT